jgi:cytochrome c-type biogenesis protein
MDAHNVSLLVALSAGLLSFLSPCVLPLVPVYLAIISGQSVGEAGKGRLRLPLFLHSVVFVLGFTLFFALLGTGAGFAGAALGEHRELIRLISGGLMVAFGVFMLAATRVPRLNFVKRLNPNVGRTTGYLRSLLIGALFAVGWTPCVGPILGGIFTLAFNTDTAARGAGLLAVYSLGLGIPFLAMGLAFDTLSPVLRRINRYSTVIYIVSGLLLITVGVLMLTNKIAWFASLGTGI